MATLVLTTVGTLIGGPIGGAIGAVIGNQLDQRLLAPSRKGPRLGDLSVQTSSYGSAIPRLFGTLRVAGTVIWATDLREDVHKSGGGKGGAKTTSYSYSCSFAVAISGRPILSVGRIWADGNLLRGSAGDWKSDIGGFRLYRGDEDQAADPLIAAAEGIDAAPAHRGIAYALFDTLQLADFGNRIPSLTFEVTADSAPVTVSAIAVELGDGALAGSGGAAVGGYAATGDSIRAAIETLAAAYPMPLCDDGSLLRIAPAEATALDPAELGSAPAGETHQPSLVRDRQAADTLPDEVAISYYEPDRDYQAGLQRARRDGIGARSQSIELAAALAADEAKGLAEAALARAWAQRDSATLSLPWRRIEARAGAGVTIDGDVWRVAGWTLERMALELKLARDGPAAAAVSASGGRATGGTDAPAGATRTEMIDLPLIGDTDADTPQLWLAAAGTAPGWRRADVSLSYDGGASWQAFGRTAAPAVMGSTVGALGPGPAALFDRVSTLEVELLNAGMALEGADQAALVAGTNLAIVGDELVQFGSAQQVSATRWRLGQWLRGRRGSEWAIAGHSPGERFVLLDPATLLALDVPLARMGAGLEVSAIGPGDGGLAALASATVIGRALRPPAPVWLAASRLDDGTIRLGWTRRSRIGWAWLDGTDAPLGEAGERYQLVLTPAGGAPRTVTVDAAGYDYAPADQAADGWSGSGTLAAGLAQLGTFAASLPAAAASWTF